MNPASLAVEVTKTARKKQSYADLLLYIVVAFTVDAYLTHKESIIMDFGSIYMPEGSELPFFIVMMVCSLVFPIVIAWYFHMESKHRGENFQFKYALTAIIMMFMTPVVSMIIMTNFVTQGYVAGDALTYIVFSVIAMVLVAFFGLKFLNEGLGACVKVIKGTYKDAKDAAEELKELKQ